MDALDFNPAICASCDTCDCLMRCQHMTSDLDERIPVREISEIVNRRLG